MINNRPGRKLRKEDNVLHREVDRLVVHVVVSSGGPLHSKSNSRRARKRFPSS